MKELVIAGAAFAMLLLATQSRAAIAPNQSVYQDSLPPLPDMSEFYPDYTGSYLLDESQPTTGSDFWSSWFDWEDDEPVAPLSDASGLDWFFDIFSEPGEYAADPAPLLADTAPKTSNVIDLFNWGKNVLETPADNGAANIAAFLMMIRTAEGTADHDGYRRMFGGKLFSSFANHPREIQAASGLRSDAAGAYQIMSYTWDDFVRDVGPRDFSPASQDEFAIWALKRRGALADVQAGRFDTAVRKVAAEWASLPGSPYGQPVITLARAQQIYADNGGSFA